VLAPTDLPWKPVGKINKPVFNYYDKKCQIQIKIFPPFDLGSRDFYRLKVKLSVLGVNINDFSIPSRKIQTAFLLFIPGNSFNALQVQITAYSIFLESPETMVYTLGRRISTHSFHPSTAVP
jgi:hypothetical protein